MLTGSLRCCCCCCCVLPLIVSLVIYKSCQNGSVTEHPPGLGPFWVGLRDFLGIQAIRGALPPPFPRPRTLSLSFSLCLTVLHAAQRENLGLVRPPKGELRGSVRNTKWCSHPPRTTWGVWGVHSLISHLLRPSPSPPANALLPRVAWPLTHLIQNTSQHCQRVWSLGELEGWGGCKPIRLNASLNGSAGTSNPICRTDRRPGEDLPGPVLRVSICVTFSPCQLHRPPHTTP